MREHKKTAITRIWKVFIVISMNTYAIYSQAMEGINIVCVYIHPHHDRKGLKLLLKFSYK